MTIYVHALWGYSCLVRREVLCGVLAADVCVLHYVHTTYMCGVLGTGAWLSCYLAALAAEQHMLPNCAAEKI